MKGRNAQIARVFRISRMLEFAPQGLTAQEILSRLDQSGEKVSLRTIYRDLDALERSGVPLLKSESENPEIKGRWRLLNCQRKKLKDENRERSLLMYFLSQKDALPFPDPTISKAMKGIFLLLESSFSDIDMKHLTLLDRIIEVNGTLQSKTPIDWDKFETFISSCLEECLLDITLSLPDRTHTQLTVKPTKIRISESKINLAVESNGFEEVIDLTCLKECEFRHSA